MEEKKSNKINISTGLLIVAIIIIIILCTYIFILLNKVDTTLDETGLLSSVDNIISTNKDTLPQLAGEFSDIKSIIKEYIDNKDVENYKDFDYDLDSDGIIDKIILKHIINENEDLYSSNRDYHVLEYNGKTICDYWEGRGVCWNC